MVDRKFGFAEDESSMDYYTREGYKKPTPEAIPTGTPTEIKLTKIDRKLGNIIDLLGLLVESKKEEFYTKSFNTGITNLPNAVIPVTGQAIDPANTNPTTGYTVVDVNIQRTPNRNAKELYFLNLGPATIFVIVSHIKNQFVGQEFPVFARNATIFDDVYELRIRTELANTRFVVSEHTLQSLPAQQFSDRDAIPRHFRTSLFGIGPHGNTLRASYTVPTGFQSQVSGVYIFLTIQTAAVVAGRRAMTIGVNSVVSGAPVSVSVMSRSIPTSENTVGALVDTAGGSELGISYLLQEGESITISTLDSSTGGTLQYFGSVIVTEYFPIG